MQVLLHGRYQTTADASAMRCTTDRQQLHLRGSWEVAPHQADTHDFAILVGRPRGENAALVHVVLVNNVARIKPSTKTKSSARRVVLDHVSAAALREWKRRQTEERLAWGPGWTETGLVFSREDGRPLHPERVSRWFAARVREAGLPTIPLKNLRHTWATLALQAGEHPKVVQERLGHSSITITLDTYSHAIPEMQAEAAQRVANLIDG